MINTEEIIIKYTKKGMEIEHPSGHKDIITEVQAEKELSYLLWLKSQLNNQISTAQSYITKIKNAAGV